VARHIFQACPVWIYTQSNITQASYSPEYITPTQQISYQHIRYVKILPCKSRLIESLHAVTYFNRQA
jgi:hypothetical protein